MLLYGVTYTARGMKDTRNTLHDCPMRILTVWKACVLVHFLHNLRYFHLESQLVNLQKKLNSSLQRTLRIYGHHLALLIDTGIPPLALTQKVQLAQLHFRLSQRHPSSVPGILFHKALPFTPYLPSASLDYTMCKAIAHLDPPRRFPNPSPLPSPLINIPRQRQAGPYKRLLQISASSIWRKDLALTTITPGRLNAFLSLNHSSIIRANLFSPAMYITVSCSFLRDLIRLRVQALPQVISSHLYFTYTGPCPPYAGRMCLKCPLPIHGNEAHTFLQCPTTTPAHTSAKTALSGTLRLVDLPAWKSFSSAEHISILLANSPPDLLKKNLVLWTQESTPICAQFARALRKLAQKAAPVNNVPTLTPTPPTPPSRDRSPSASAQSDSPPPPPLPQVPPKSPPFPPPSSTMLYHPTSLQPISKPSMP